MQSPIKAIRQNIYRLNYIHAPKLNHRLPIDVSLELASVCNMACTYCYHGDPKTLPFVKGYMDKDLAFKIILQSADLGVNSIKFNWKGEATLNPHYLDIVSLAKDFARGSTFIDRITNSNFKIPPSKREQVFEGFTTLTKIKVSYDSFIKDVFEKQRAGGNHELTTENIDLFYNHPLRVKTETELVIQAVRTNLNKDEDIEGKAKIRWPEAVVSIRDMVSGRTTKDLSEFQNRARDVENRQTCIQAHARLIFNHEGKAMVCCPDIAEKLCVGDARVNTVKEIFNSEKAVELRKSLLNKSAFSQDPCKNCPSFESYKGYVPPKES